jgi:hypothetical protein
LGNSGQVVGTAGDRAWGSFGVALDIGQHAGAEFDCSCKGEVQCVQIPPIAGGLKA